MTLAAVVFDLDYTLAVPARDRQTLLDEAADRAGVGAIDRAEYLAVHGDHRARETREPIFEELVGSRASEDVSRAYREVINDSLAPVSGAEELIRELRTQYRVGLLTDGPVKAQQSKLEALGWEDLFDGVVITGSLPAAKPDGQAFDAILTKLGVAAGVTVYVGDNPVADVRGAKDAGMVAVQVLTERFERAPEADYYIERDRLTEQLKGVLTHHMHSQ